jgi:hypothetical protein
MMDVPMELVAKEAVVAAWNLGRAGEVGEVRKPLEAASVESGMEKTRRTK